ncbi:uncharacterized protein LOC126965740 [Leptidea sinapis]|uniref:uncharacterized protein LOC126965740 n=1 Tax=Leptidea sinapis TaxID=189913 RepID=UPI0021417939|nr:uncharacterized protein LOC126965740 [Leptidea sinapis]
MKIYICFIFFLFAQGKYQPCDTIWCSNVHDPVCGEVRTIKGKTFVKRFHNKCHLEKIKCRFDFIDVQEVPIEICLMQRAPFMKTRKVNDFSIVGAHQACNHTCPTYCLDTYDPACAQIWTANMQSYTYRPMINHCHIDMFSCVMGVNVTIHPLIGKCYSNPSALNFMFNIASLKSLKLLDEDTVAHVSGLPVISNPKRRSNTRSFNYVELKEIKEFVELLIGLN